MPAELLFAEPLLPFAVVNGDGALSLPVDVREHPAEYTVVADLPGVEPTTVEVTVDGDVLTITGARRERLDTGGVPVRLERPTGNLRRSLRLPAGCDGTKIHTRFRDGVLEIAVPKRLSSRPGTREEVITRATSPPVARPNDPGRRVAPGPHGHAKRDDARRPARSENRPARRKPA
jgi:HSP20 family molecular chaperone IbpA